MDLVGRCAKPMRRLPAIFPKALAMVRREQQDGLFRRLIDDRRALRDLQEVCRDRGDLGSAPKETTGHRAFATTSAMPAESSALHFALEPWAG